MLRVARIHRAPRAEHWLAEIGFRATEQPSRLVPCTKIVACAVMRTSCERAPTDHARRRMWRLGAYGRRTLTSGARSRPRLLLPDHVEPEHRPTARGSVPRRRSLLRRGGSRRLVVPCSSVANRVTSNAASSCGARRTKRAQRLAVRANQRRVCRTAPQRRTQISPATPTLPRSRAQLLRFRAAGADGNDPLPLEDGAMYSAP